MALVARRSVAVILALFLAGCGLLLAAALFPQAAVGAATYTVTLASDTLPGGVEGELRWAINQANLDAEPDTIEFAIPGEGAHVITPTGALPIIDQPVLIDGFSQAPEPPGIISIYIDGADAGDCNGLSFVAGSDGSRVTGLSVYNFSSAYRAGLWIEGAQDIQVDGCYFGVDNSGTAKPNYYGVHLENEADNNTIGGDEEGEYSNLISGNAAHGVYVFESSGNAVGSNFIGTNQAGTAALANSGDGVHVEGMSSGNLIGLSSLISGNGSDGIEFDNCTANLVAGCLIGTDIYGTGDLGNAENGIRIFDEANGNFIGFLFTAASSKGGSLFPPSTGNAAPMVAQVPAFMNVISGNGNSGVLIEESSGNMLAGNMIGTDINGENRLDNSHHGVALLLATGNYIGTGFIAGSRLDGTAKLNLPATTTPLAAQNLISGNSRNGIYMIGSSGNYVLGNVIGAGFGVENRMPNGWDGIHVYLNSNDNIIGAGSEESPNAIIYNGRDGVSFEQSTYCQVSGNIIAENQLTGVAVLDKDSYSDTISENMIFGNGALGISLGGSGVPTPNDGNNDNPDKPNRGFNYPVFSKPNFDISGGNVEVSGTAPPNSLVELFLTGEPDPSGHGEGLAHLESVTADASGRFSTTLTGLSAGDRISSTATQGGGILEGGDLKKPVGYGSTSEFSANAVIGGVELDVIKAAEPATPVPGTEVTYTISITNNGTIDAAGVTFTDDIPEHTTVVSGSVTCSDAGASVAGEDPVKITGMTVETGKTVTVSFEVIVDEDVPAGTVISNQGKVIYSGETTLSSDPEHPGDGRPTDVTVEERKTAGAREWYIAEGSTGGGFDTWILLENPNPGEVEARLTFSTESGPLEPVTVTIGADGARATVRVAEYVPDTWGVSTIVEADEPVVAERSMYWDRNTMGDTGVPGTPQPYEMKGGSSNLGVPVEAVTGAGSLRPAGGQANYFPEGATAGGFDTWILLVNPNEEEANAKVTLMNEAGVAAEKQVTVGPLSRQTVHLDELLPDAFEVATEVTSDIPLVAERSMYWDPAASGLEPYQMKGGHSNAGSPTPAREWFCAEGATAGGFDTWILLQNPGANEAAVTATFMDETGASKEAELTMPPSSRASIRASDYVPENFHVSTKVTSDSSIVAERSTYWDKRLAAQPYEMRDGTSTVGVTKSSTTWVVPEGSTGMGFDTFVLITNTENEEVDASVHFLNQLGEAARTDITIPASSRYTLRLSDYLPDEFQVSTMVTGDGMLVVERAMYWDRREPSPTGEPEIRPYEMMGGHSSNGLDP